jgi:hypothetical protein
MKAKTTSGGNADESLYVTFPDIQEALPYYMRGAYTRASFQKQKYNSELYLPFFRAPRHHAPPYWVLADVLRWILHFPLTPSDLDNFARDLRARATPTPPTMPLRRSGAGNYPRDDESVAYRARKAELNGRALTGWVPASQRKRKSLHP